MGGLVVRYPYLGASYRAELGMVNMVCVAGVGRYPRDGCDSPADQRRGDRSSKCVSQLTLGQ